MAAKYKKLKDVIECPEEQSAQDANKDVTINNIENTKEKPKKWYMQYKDWIFSFKALFTLFAIVVLAVIAYQSVELHQVREECSNEKSKRENLEDQLQRVEKLLQPSIPLIRNQTQLEKEYQQLQQENHRLKQEHKNLTAVQASLSSDFRRHTVHTNETFADHWSKISLLALKQRNHTQQLNELKLQESATQSNHYESEEVWFVVSGKAFTIVFAILIIVLLINLTYCAVRCDKYCNQVKYTVRSNH